MKHLRFFSVLFGICICCLSCDKDESSVPSDLIEFNLMRDILMDLHVAEAIAGKKGGPKLHREMMREDLQVEVLEKYGMSKETFFESYQYYLKHPLILDSVYANIIQILEEKSKDDKKNKTNDSIKSEELPAGGSKSPSADETD